MREGSPTPRNIFSNASSPGPGPDLILAPGLTRGGLGAPSPGDPRLPPKTAATRAALRPFPSRSRRNSSRTAAIPAQISSSVRAGAVPASACNSRSRFRIRSRLSIVRLIRRSSPSPAFARATRAFALGLLATLCRALLFLRSLPSRFPTAYRQSPRALSQAPQAISTQRRAQPRPVTRPLWLQRSRLGQSRA